MSAPNLSPHEVATLQLQLKLTGDYPGLLHGKFDEPTRDALIRFQEREMSRAASGVLDRDTRQALDRCAYATFDQQLRVEVDEIARARPPQLKTSASAADAESQVAAHEARLVGLAFSGGGIRSATFNLGVIQALCELRLLHLFDYVSTVSGGGYIGSWLSALITRRHGDLDGVARELCPQDGEAAPPGYSRESPAIRFLRGYSNYLTPRLGLLSADTLSAVATYLRNLYLNLSILILFLVVLLLLPRVLVALISTPSSAEVATLPERLVWLGLALLVVPTSAIVGANLAYRTPAPGTDPPWYARTGAILSLFWVPGGVGAYLLSYWFSIQPQPDLGLNSAWWSLVGAMLALVAWSVGGAAYLVASAGADRWQVHGAIRTARDARSPWRFVSILGAALAAGAVGGVLFYWFTELLGQIWNIPQYGPDLARWLAVGLGTVVVMKLLAIALTLHVGLAGRQYSEDVREWWSRLGGSALAVAAAWLLLFLISVYVVPPMVSLRREWDEGGWVTTGAVATWLGSTLAGVLLGKSEKTGTRDGAPARRVIEIVARVAPYVFIVGLLAGLSIAIDSMLPALANVRLEHTDPGTFLASADQQFREMDAIPLWILLGTAGVCFATGVALSWRVDINLFSLYGFYRNRLTRCYLGATRAPNRQPQPFTGFDPEDDLPLHRLGRISGGGHVESQRPYHIVNTALNLVHGKDLEWQQRKAASFTFTPKFSGFELPPTADSRGYADPGDKAPVEKGERALPGAAAAGLDARSGATSAGRHGDTDRGAPPARGCFRPTARTMHADGATLGAALAISGAAASPNMGYHSSPALAFLMTVFNVRLGRWCGNPVDREAWTQPGPLVAAWRLLRELLGLTTSTSRYLYLSDGGHFENLGLYELVRRRCRFIVACDAGQDQKVTFEDLGNAIRKCYADLGIPIELDVAPLRPRGEEKRSAWHCAVGSIRYDQRDPGAVPGLLLYLKPSLVGDEPADVLHYASTDPTFPHQTTNDQWFDESQFESYRKLGYHIAKGVLEPAKEMAEAEAVRTPEQQSEVFADVEGLMVALKSIWHPPAKGGAAVFTRHTKTLDAIYERLRNDQQLRFLDAQIYPNWRAIAAGTKYEAPLEQWLPDSYLELREGFYLCNGVMQLMENVYLDLELETQFDHPDNRGWMNLFRHWAWCNMFRVTWAMSAATYGMRFQSFCKRHLGLALGDVAIQDIRETGTVGALNFLEENLVSQLVEQHKHLRRDALQIDRIELVVSNPQAPTKSIRLPVGMAITLATAAGTELLFFRIQDHLRRMGLARVALRQLIHAREVTRARPLSLAKPALETVGSAEQQRFERLFRSVSYELEKG